jgi:hypothetical protein
MAKAKNAMLILSLTCSVSSFGQSLDVFNKGIDVLYKSSVGGQIQNPTVCSNGKDVLIFSEDTRFQQMAAWVAGDENVMAQPFNQLKIEVLSSSTTLINGVTYKVSSISVYDLHTNYDVGRLDCLYKIGGGVR